MTKGRRHTTLLLLLWAALAAAQPDGYYSTAEGLTGIQLKQALHNIIDNHTVSTYTDLWTHFQSTDKRADGNVWDIYSTITYQFITDQCGNYSSEGDCYNREHSFPKSWFGGEITPMYTDLFHLYPTDGYVNGKRANLPYGETTNPTWSSSNGSRLGISSVPGYSGEIFEPADEYKGDLARTYFYMAVRYYGEDASWPGSPMVDGAEPLPWALDMLLDWHADDPVSQKEIDRNTAVYAIQGNRNPFIDRQQFVSAIWDINSLSPDHTAGREQLIIYPNPSSGPVSVTLPTEIKGTIILKIMSPAGKILITSVYNAGETINPDLSSLGPGIYIVVAEGESKSFRQKIIRL